jgi:ankyrin repeat protein
MPIDKEFNDKAWTTIPAFIWAAHQGDIPALEKQLKDGMKIDAQNINGTTALMAAVDEAKDGAVQFLLEKGADVNMRNRAGWSALDLAADLGNLKLVEALIAKGADATTANDCDAPFIRYTGGKELRGRDLGVTPLMITAEKGFEDIAHVLLARGTDVNAADKWGSTALMRAASGGFMADSGHPGMLRLLLAAGADANACDGLGHTAFWHAACKGDAESTAVLLAATDITKEPKPVGPGARQGGWVPRAGADGKVSRLDDALLNAVVFGKNIEVVRMLIEKGADVNTRHAASGASLVYCAAQGGQKDMTQFLLDKGADAAVCNDHRMSPESAAATPEIRDLIKAAQAKNNPPPAPAPTPTPPPPAA